MAKNKIRNHTDEKVRAIKSQLDREANTAKQNISIMNKMINNGTGKLVYRALMNK